MRATEKGIRSPDSRFRLSGNPFRLPTTAT